MEFRIFGGIKLLHKYELNGLNIVIDVNSGSVHVFDEIAYDVVDFIQQPVENAISSLKEKHTKEEIIEAYNELIKLQQDGQLNSSDTYRDKILSEKKEMHTKALCSKYCS